MTTEDTETGLAVRPVAQLALTTPPSGDEWKAMERQATMLANTAFVPQHYRGKPHEVLACVMTARELGIGPMLALRKISIIQGTPTMTAELMVALVRRAGHSLEGTTSATSATVHGRRADTGNLAEFTYTLEMAKRAKLLEKDNWRNYPESMCWARAVSQICRMLFSDVLMGVTYTPDEAGGVVTAEGELVDSPKTPAHPTLDDEQKLRLTAMHETLPPEHRLQPASRRALVDKGYEAAYLELVALHHKACGEGCAHVTGELVEDPGVVGQMAMS